MCRALPRGTLHLQIHVHSLGIVFLKSNEKEMLFFFKPMGIFNSIILSMNKKIQRLPTLVT